MLQWKIQDDHGLTHQFMLPNSYFFMSARLHILCPQHLAQVTQDNFPLPLGTGEVTGDKYIQLFSDQGCYIELIKLDPKCNTGMTHTTLGIHKFKEFTAQQVIQTPCPCHFDTNIIPDNDDILLQQPDPIDHDDQEQPPPFPLQ